MRVLKIILGSVVALFVGVTVVGFFLPTSIRVERSALVQASAPDIYPLIASFKDGWPQWSPFGQAEDPEMQMHYGGPALGAGAKQSWESPRMGDGHMEITKADPQSGIAYDLMLMHDSFRLNGSLVCAPAGAGTTKVTWVDEVNYGKNPYRRYMGLAVKRPLEKAFDKGLAELKRKAEARATTRM
jgi:hypothetical protein